MKKAIVIGATSGIGRGLAQQLAQNGYKVGITGRRADLLAELKRENPSSFFTSCFDACDTSLTVQKLQELVNDLGGLDLLIISAGTGDINKHLDFDIDKKIIDLNVTGFTNIADWAFNYFEKQGRGHLGAISSIAGLRGLRGAPGYNASKAFQITYLQSLRHQAHHSKKPIYVTDIRPGFVDTPMAKGGKYFWMAKADKAVSQIFKAIKKKKKVAYITKRWWLIAILLKILPGWIFNRI